MTNKAQRRKGKPSPTKNTLPDLQRAKRNPAYFAEAFLGVKLFPYQKRVVVCSKPTVVHVAGRGAGKTVELAALAAWFLFTKRRSIVVYISARERQGKIARNELLGMLAGTDLYADIIESSYEKITLSTQSTIYFLPGASPVACRGLHNRLTREGEQPTEILLILDESANIPRETYVAALNILNTARKGKRKRLVVGSPLGTNHWFYEEWTAGMDPQEKFTKAFHTNSEDCPHVSQDFLTEMFAKLSPIEYNAEIRAQFQEALNSYFAGYVDGAIRQYSLPVECSTEPGVEYSLGLDLSSSARLGSDFTVFVVVEHWPGGVKTTYKTIDGAWHQHTGHVDRYIRICDIRRFQYLDNFAIRRELKDITHKYSGIKRVTCETYESMQLEAMCGSPAPVAVYRGASGHTYTSAGTNTDKVPVKLNRISPTNPLQREAFSYFHQLLRDGILQLPAEGDHVSELLKELKHFQIVVTDAGNIRFGAIEEGGAKDDCVYALCWAIWGLDKRARENMGISKAVRRH